jgi:hypothetical protein
MKFAAARPYAEPEAAARKLLELANAFETIQEGRNETHWGKRKLKRDQ